MTTTVLKFERRARYIMSVVSGLLLFVMVAWDMGWIRSTPLYNDASWYAVNEHSGFVVTSEYQDESACLRDEKTPGSCRSGKSLAEEQIRNATSIERS